MPKPLSRKYVEDYDSDDGFVEDAPKSKKRKAEQKPRNADVRRDEDGSTYWEVSDSETAITNSTLTEVALRQTACHNLRLQRQYDGRHSRVLREGRQSATRQEGQSMASRLKDTVLMMDYRASR